MSEFLPLKDTIHKIVKPGMAVALEGFTHLIPFAAGHEIIRQKINNLTLIKMTPDLVYDQLIGAGCAKKMIFSWGGNPGVGSLHRFRDAYEKAWPHQLEIEERSHADMANAYSAGASKLPFAILKAYKGTGLPQVNPRIKFITCPFTGEEVAAVPAVNPDVTIIHAQQADRKGNILLWGIFGIQKEAVLSAKKVIVTVEEVVDRLEKRPESVYLPNWVIDAISEVPGGSFPSYSLGYTKRNNKFYQEWDSISRDREKFIAWIQVHIQNTNYFSEFLELIKNED